MSRGFETLAGFTGTLQPCPLMPNPPPTASAGLGTNSPSTHMPACDLSVLSALFALQVGSDPASAEADPTPKYRYNFSFARYGNDAVLMRQIRKCRDTAELQVCGVWKLCNDSYCVFLGMCSLCVPDLQGRGQDGALGVQHSAGVALHCGVRSNCLQSWIDSLEGLP